MILTTAIVTASDPSDPVPNLERLLVKHSKLDDGSMTNLILENCQYFCNVCKTHVFEGSKHCSYCNRCTYGFDHHCRWVSNDIGTLNYASFIRMLIATIATLILQIIEIVAYLSSDRLKQDSHVTLNYITISICILFLIPLSILFGFHTYLIKK